MPDLLVELLSEEIPARMQARAAEDLRRLVTDGLVERGLTYAHAAAFATPRRLTLAIAGLTERSPDLREERRGPRTGAPEAAVEGFLRSTGLTRDQLERRPDKKAEVWFAVTTRPGRPTAEIVAETLEATLRGFPWPKSMRWGAGEWRWVRPLQSILCILSTETGAEVVPFAFEGLAAGGTTRGHRFMAPAPFRVIGYEDYAAKLQSAFVLLDPADRAARIWNDATQLAFAQGLEPVEDPALLAEVAGLVEWPVVLMGRIEQRFLDLPPEVLQTAMRTHQKFFSARDPRSGRIEAYIVTANRDTTDDGVTILAGNARVLAARLADAAFFWANDLRTPLEDMLAKLGKVTFHNKLGTQADRIARIALMAREIAPHVGADLELAENAARVAKADLASAMVYEFPELQGTMGRYYAERAGKDPAVAVAVLDHYSPLGRSNAIPIAPVSIAVALADKVDILTSFWAIPERPTGSKDPFALRRASIGAMRIFLSSGGSMELPWLLYRSTFIHLLVAAQTAHCGSWAFEEASRTLDPSNPFDRMKIFRCFLCRSVEEEIFADEIFKRTINDGHDLRREELSQSQAELIFLNWDSETANRAVKYSAVMQEREREISKFIPLAREKTSGADDAAAIDLESQFPLLSAYINEVVHSLLTFFADRLKVYLREQGIRHDVIDACFQLGGQDDLVLLVARVRALQAFLDTEDGANLLTGYRRANNILTQEEKKDGVEYSLDPDPRLAETDAERALFTALDAAGAALELALAAEDFVAAMTALARLRPPIDAFFDSTTVNADSPIVRRNRLCLLNRIRAVMNRVAIFSALEGG